MATIEAWVAPAAKSSLVRQKVELGPLGDEEVEVEVEHCGLCHSDLSIRNNDWGSRSFRPCWGTKPLAEWSKSDERPRG